VHLTEFNRNRSDSLDPVTYWQTVWRN